MSATSKGWALWFVGIPGSGKSSVAQCVFDALLPQDDMLMWLQMDAWRKSQPTSGYSREERDQTYRNFLQEAVLHVDHGFHVLMDATAYQLTWRQQARVAIARFAEVYIECPLEVAMERESSRPEGLVMTELYRKALLRKQTGQQFPDLGEMIGIDVPFEVDPNAECVIDSVKTPTAQASEQVIAFLRECGWINKDTQETSH